MITNKHGIEILYHAFKEAADGEEYLTQAKFHYSIILLAQAIFGTEDEDEDSRNPFEEMFTQILLDKTVSQARIPRLDQDTKEVLSEPALVMYMAYTQQLKRLFLNYTDENLLAQDKDDMIAWEEVSDRNIHIKTGGLLKFCKDYRFIPHLFNIESL